MKLIIAVLLLVISNIHAKVITSKPSWATTTRNNAVYGAFCDMKFDTDNGNYTYDCKGVILSEFNVYDINDFIVGSNDNRGVSGNGTITHINGNPSWLGGRGRITDSTSYFMRCSYGYIQTSYNSEYCITKPDNSLYGAYEGAEYGYRCISGYDDIDGNCVKSCKYNQFFNGDECINIPKHAYKTSYNDYECNQGYEYQERSVQKCVKSCNDNEVMDSLYRCKPLYTNDFKKHCSGRIDIVYGDTTKTCDNGWDYCVEGEQNHAVKLPLNARTIENDCVTIQSCNDGYYNKDDRNCVMVPKNATKTASNMWECDSGYIKEDGYCRHVICDEHAVIDIDKCTAIPNNSVKTSEYSWECKEDFSLFTWADRTTSCVPIMKQKNK